MAKNGKASKQEMNWSANPRWAGVTRLYTAEDVERLRGSLRIEYTLARNGAERLWELLHSQSYLPALGAMTGNQAVQQVKAGLQAIYVSGWQVAADANDAGQMYPDQSLYPADSVPNVVRRINHLLTSDIDPRDHEFLTGNRTAEGFFCIRGGLESAIARSLSYAPYADLLWWETSEPNLEEARQFAEAVLAEHPGKMLAYNCSPSFNWKKKLDDTSIARFQTELAAMGYKFQFITLAGFHSLNLSMFELARAYRLKGMAAYSKLQEREFAAERDFGYEAFKHQQFVGTGYFDKGTHVIAPCEP